MNRPADSPNPFDPLGILKSVRDAGLDQWSQALTQWVHSDAYAQANGQWLDAWLTGSGPFRDALQTTMNHALAECNLPSRNELAQIAERLTHIEMRLDDMESKLDVALPPDRKES